MEKQALLILGRWSVIKHIRYLGRRTAQYYKFRREFIRFKTLINSHRFPVEWTDRYPRMGESTSKSAFDRHYIYHTAWAARVLARTRPSEHIDISSSLYFAAILSALIPIRYYDFRPPELQLNNLSVDHADLMALPFQDRSISSLSSMHVVEHIGLGRYGGPLDPDGDLKAISELKRVTAIGGDLIFVVPVGQPKLMFNAHRIYSYDQIIGYFTDFEMREFALIPDEPKDGGLIPAPSKDLVNAQRYGCGCFWFRK